MTLEQVKEKIKAERICFSDYDFDYWEKSDFFKECEIAEKAIKEQGFICNYVIPDDTKQLEIWLYYKTPENKNCIGVCRSWYEVKMIADAVKFATNY